MRVSLSSLVVIGVAALLAPCSCFANDVMRNPAKKKGAGPLFQIHYGEKWGYLDRRGKTVIPPQFDDEGDFFGGLAKIRQGGDWGYIDEAGRVVIRCQFDDAGDFREGLAPVRVGRKWGFVDRTGKFVIEPRFQAAAEFSDGLALFEVWDTAKCDALPGEGKALYTNDDAPPYAFVLHCVRPVATGGCSPTKDRYGFVDKKGNIAIAPRFRTASSFSEGRAFVKEEGPPNKYGYIDTAGRMAIAPQFDQAEPFSEGLAAVEIGVHIQDGKVVGQWGFINREGKFEIPATFRDAHSFSEGLAAVERQDRAWGYIDKRGVFVIPPNYSQTNPFSDGLALVWDDMGYYIDRTGKRAFVMKLWPGWPFSDGLTVAGEIGKRQYVDRKGKTIAPYEVDPGI
jgi:hypothetical protein